MEAQSSPPVPLGKTLVLVNQFIIETTRFLNHFSTIAEDKLRKISNDISRIETSLVLLESRLGSVDLPGFNDLAVAATSIPTATQLLISTGAAVGDANLTAQLPTIQDAPASSSSTTATPAPPTMPPSSLPMAPGAAAVSTLASSTTTTSIVPHSQPQAVPQQLQLPPAPGAIMAVPAPQNSQTAVAPTPPVAAPAPAPVAAAAASNVIALKDCQYYGKFFKMLKFGIPPPAVKIKMGIEGLDPNVLDMDSEGPTPFQDQGPDGAAIVAVDE